MRCPCWPFAGKTLALGDIELLELETPQQVVIYRCMRCNEIHSEETSSAEGPELTLESSPYELRTWLWSRLAEPGATGMHRPNRYAA